MSQIQHRPDMFYGAEWDEAHQLYALLKSLDSNDPGRGLIAIQIIDMLPEFLNGELPWSILDADDEEKNIHATLKTAALQYTDIQIEKLRKGEFPETPANEECNQHNRFLYFNNVVRNALTACAELDEDKKAIAERRDRYTEAAIEQLRVFYNQLCDGSFSGFANAAEMAKFIRHEITEEMGLDLSILDATASSAGVEMNMGDAVANKAISLYQELQKRTLTDPINAQFLVDEIRYLLDCEKIDYRVLDPEGIANDDQILDLLNEQVSKRQYNQENNAGIFGKETVGSVSR